MANQKLSEGSGGELNLLYYLFQMHNMTPEEFYKLTPGERVPVNAFCEKEYGG